MQFTILTLFPEMFSPLKESVLKRAQQTGLLDINYVNFRDYALSKHKNVDDVPYGGGAGMVLKPEPIFAAMRDLPEPLGQRKVILLTPQGKQFTQQLALELSENDELVLICGHYEGFDDRIRELANEEVSIGNFVLTGGELAAMVIVDAVARLIPGVLGEQESFEDDSYMNGLLEYPQYTRPAVFEGRKVPDILLSGHHAKIKEWRRKESFRRTFLKRPDLIEAFEFKQEDYLLLEQLALEEPVIEMWRHRWNHLKPIVKKKHRSSRRQSSNE